MMRAEKAAQRLNPAFASVKESVSKMRSDLQGQKKDEEKQKDACVAELRQLDKDMTATENERADLTTKIGSIKDSLTALAEQIVALKGQISDSKVEIKKAGEDRELANKDFQATVTDQRATQAVLKKAVDRLKEFYDKKALLQTKAT